MDERLLEPTAAADNQSQAEKIRHQPTVDLKMKLGLLNKVIKEAQAKGDVRWKNVVPQARRIKEELDRRRKEDRHQRGEAEPEPVRVGMRAARLKARRLGM